MPPLKLVQPSVAGFETGFGKDSCYLFQKNSRYRYMVMVYWQIAGVCDLVNCIVLYCCTSFHVTGRSFDPAPFNQRWELSYGVNLCLYNVKRWCYCIEWFPCFALILSSSNNILLCRIFMLLFFSCHKVDISVYKWQVCVKKVKQTVIKQTTAQCQMIDHFVIVHFFPKQMKRLLHPMR